MDTEAAYEELVTQARYQLWREGRAHEFALDENQQKWRESFWATDPLSSSVWNIGRQVGKTHTAVFLALELGSKKKNAIIRYCAKTKDSAVGLVGPAWKMLVETMPVELRPIKGRNEYEWVFPSTGATFVLFGTDAQSFAKGRGPRTDLQFFDECGFYQDLEATESALIPSLQTTGGRALYLSTPAETLAHPYIKRIYAASANGRLQHATIYDNPRVDAQAVIAAEAQRKNQEVQEFIQTTYFKREFLAQLVQEETTAGFPSFTIESYKTHVQEFQMPKFYDGYVSMDVGLTNDPHFGLLMAHDWENDRVLVLDELELRSDMATLRVFSDRLKELEKHHFGTNLWNGTLMGLPEHFKKADEAPTFLKDILFKEAPRQPFYRVIDASSGADKELSREHGYACVPAQKHNKALSVDSANTLLASGRVIIHPRCKKLIEQLLSAQWNNQRTGWIHTPTHHFDGCDVFIYGLRAVLWRRAANYPRRSNMDWLLVPDDERRRQQGLQSREELRNIFRGPRR